MKKIWLATAGAQSCLFTAVIFGLLFSPISVTTALKLNGTTTTTVSTPLARPSDVQNLKPSTSEDDQKTTLASFLQPDVSETTLNPHQAVNQDDELTTTQHIPPSSLAKRHSSIHVSDSSSSSSFIHHHTSLSKEKPYRNGTQTAVTNTAEENEQSLSLSSTAEQIDDESIMPSATENDSNTSEGSSTFANSLGTEEKESLSLDKDESDDGPNWSEGTGSGVIEGDVIFPPEDNDGVNSEELEGTTGYESLVRPGPTLNPKSFASQLTSKLNRSNSSSSGSRTSSRLGTRGLSSKSELNAINATPSANAVNFTSSPTSASAKNTTTSFHRIRNNHHRRNNYTDNIANGDSSSDRDNVSVSQDNRNDRNSSSLADYKTFNDSNNISFDLNGTSFSSRSNLDQSQQLSIHPQPQQFHRPRPTASVINYNSNHNNNLHNRIIKRKKIPLGRNETTGGSSLSSIYGNSILTSTLSTNTAEAAENVEVPIVASTPATSVSTLRGSSSNDDPALLGEHTTSVDVTTESNSLLNASQQEGNSDEGEQHKEQQSSPPSTSGGSSADVNVGHNNNLTTPDSDTDSLSEEFITGDGNGTSPYSSSRAILGFGAANNAADLGKIKRPKPIIIRDHEDSLYVNNISENAALASGNSTGHSHNNGHVAFVNNNNEGSDETPTFNVGSAGEDENSNKPVGSNALPTPSSKVKRVKLNPRRQPTSSGPVLHYEELAKSSSFSTMPLPPTRGGGEPISSTSAGLIEAAPATPNYMQFQDAIRPSLSHYEPPLFSSTRYFGFSHESYNDGHGEDYPNGNVGLDATTEVYFENTTPYPLVLGVRSVGRLEESDDANNREIAGINRERNVAGSHNSRITANNNDNSDDNSAYRDYYSEIRSSAADYGSGGAVGNLHIKLDSHREKDEIGSSSISPVTVTVTHTVVETTPYVMPTAGISQNGNHHHHQQNIYHRHDHDVAKRGNINPNLHPTPALPTSLLASSTQTTVAGGQGPDAISHSVDNIQFSTSRFDIRNSGVHAINHDDDKHHKSEMTPAMPQSIEPTPTIATNDMKSVHFTQVSHPHLTSSSPEVSTTRMYTYSYPDHDGTQHGHDDDDDEPPQHENENKQNNSTQTEHHANPEENGKGSSTATVDYMRSTTLSQSLNGSGNATKSSSTQLPVTTMDQDEGDLSTQMIDIDIYTPQPEARPSSKIAEITTPPTTGTMPSTTISSTNIKNGGASQVPGSFEDNEISEEEQRKQNATTSTTTTTTTLKPTPNEKNKDPNDKSIVGGTPILNGNGGVANKNFTDSDTDRDHAIITSNDDENPKTPFGVGESFGIGSVHVPIMVQMVLDVTQPVFCSHMTNFKEMIVTVYESQQNLIVNPNQIVIFTKPECKSSKGFTTENPTHTIDGISGSTLRPEALVGTSPSFAKGTYPLTSPPTTLSSLSSTDDGKESNPQKGILPKEGVTNKNSSDQDSNNNGKSTILIEGASSSVHQNKSAIRVRRSTKMGTSASAANLSDDSKVHNNSTLNSNSTENLFSVYFYMNDKSGSYDQVLTSSFVRLWNDSSRLTNVSNDNSSGDNNAAGGNDGSNGNSNEMFFHRVKKVGMITASHLISTENSSDENSGIIIAITVASVIAVCLFVLGVGLLVMRHRQSQTKFAKRCTPVTLDDYSLDNISVYNSFRRKQRLRGSKRSYTNAAFDDPNAPSKPLNASQLAAAVTDVSSLENEFEAIPNEGATMDDIPNGAETKNRYANVLPMPDSRVLLTFQEDVPNSDYINANHIRGPNGEPKRYIITQGPLEDTTVDFWRMVWEQQIRIIFMLTDFAEGGIAKCAEYYPRSETIDCSQLHGDFQITLEKKDTSDNCTTSFLVIKDMERNLRRDVVHLWYHSWPDKGVPASPKMTIDFLNRSKKFTKEPIPILIHCSPGTGRSGTVVACDIAMKEYDSQSKIDIPRIVMKIRQDRCGAVQTKEQYVHIYDVLHSYVSRIGSANLESI